MMDMKPNVKLASNILIFMVLLFLTNEALKFLIIKDLIFDHNTLLWPWVIVNKLTLYSMFGFYPAMRLMGRHNERFATSVLLVFASSAIVCAGGYLLQWLLPEYALNNILKSAIYQLYLGMLMLGILGRLGKFELEEKDNNGED